jgi:hypothetical protein
VIIFVIRADYQKWTGIILCAMNADSAANADMLTTAKAGSKPMTDLPVPICRLCKCAPIRLIDGSVKHDELSSRCSLRLSVLTGAEWTALMGVDHPAIADPVDDHAAMRERQHIMITSQGWDRAQGTAFADGWTQCAYHYGIRQNKKMGEQQ